MKYYLFFFIFIFISCEKSINIDIPGGNGTVVLNGTLCPDSVVNLRLTRSKNVRDSGLFIPIKNASVKLYQTDSLIENLIDIGNGYYTTLGFKPTQGILYKLIIQTSQNEHFECIDSIPNIVKINHIDTSWDKNNLLCSVSLIDPAGIKNYYFLRIFKISQNGSFVAPINFISYNSNGDSTYNSKFLFFDDIGFQGKRYEIIITLNNPEYGSYYFVLASISESYYNYCKSLQQISNNSGNLFFENTQIKGNIKGGKGIFAAFSNDIYSIEL